MNFSKPQKVQQTIREGDAVEFIRQKNRVKVTDAANCNPPLTKEEAKKLGVKINVNWGSLLVLLSHARRQYLTAFLSNQHFFKVSMPYAPKESRSEWEAFVTEEINKVMRNSLKYFEHHRSRWASVVTHGVGPMIWYGKDGWCPEFKAMSDLRVATDTTLDFENLGWFGVREIYTPFQLVDEVFNNRPNNHWSKKDVQSILKNYKEINFVEASQNYDWENSPEKLAELIKQDGGYFSGDAMPGIPLWHFYFKDEGGWYMRVVPESGAVRGPEPEGFLWESDVPIAARRDQIMQCQFGDLTTDAPFKYHSVRSLGYILLEPEFYDNLTRCRLLQHIHDNFNIWLRSTDPADRARASVQEFANLSVLKPGLTVVPQNERHQINSDLVEMAMAQLQQLKQNASSTYTQQVDTGTKKEQTAFDTSVKMQQVNAMLGGLLLTAGKYAKFEYKEECRRFCLSRSYDNDIKTFQKRCKEFGIPRRYLNVDLMEVEPVLPIGSGNPTVAHAAAQELMQNRMAYEPSAQQAILHEFTQIVTGDARKAAEWAPVGKVKDVTAGAEYISGVFGTLMQGVPVHPPEKISPIEQIEALIPLFAAKIAIIEKRDNVGKPDEIMGLQNVYQYLTGLVQRLAADKEQQQRVKQYMDAIGQLENQVKGLSQRGAEAMKKQQQANGSQVDPKAMVAAGHAQRMANIKETAAQRKADREERQASDRHVREQRRLDAATHSDLQRGELKAQVEHQRQMAAFQE
jgi:hypothetical protein